MSLSDPIPQQARTELERLARRWQQLPLDRALAHVPAILELAQQYADAARRACTAQDLGAGEAGPDTLPDLGPASVIDQLTVTAYDLMSLDRAPDLSGTLADDLAALRRRIG